MITIRQAALPDDRHAVQGLFAEYLGWVCPRIYEEYGAMFDAESIFAHDMETVEIFMPPNGWLFLAFDNHAPAGCACVRRTSPGVAELKRMYVRPDFRRKGIGRLLVAASVDAVRDAGIPIMRLDSAGFMSDAHALYRSCGFRDRSPYDESEIPTEHRRHWVFMELELTGRASRLDDSPK